MREDIMFTSESVTDGHPDKLCDQISDAVVDEFLIQDPYARIRVECAVSSAILFIAANFASIAQVDLANAARKVIKEIGYDQPDFNGAGCSILTAPRSLPIDPEDQFAAGNLTDAQMDKIVAKNQVTLFGFACDQSPALIPLPIYLAHRLALARKEKILPYLSPEGKVQVGIWFRGGVFQRVHSVTVTACQQKKGHAPHQYPAGRHPGVGYFPGVSKTGDRPGSRDPDPCESRRSPPWGPHPPSRAFRPEKRH